MPLQIHACAILSPTPPDFSIEQNRNGLPNIDQQKYSTADN